MEGRDGDRDRMESLYEQFTGNCDLVSGVVDSMNKLERSMKVLESKIKGLSEVVTNHLNDSGLHHALDSSEYRELVRVEVSAQNVATSAAN